MRYAVSRFNLLLSSHLLPSAAAAATAAESNTYSMAHLIYSEARDRQVFGIIRVILF